MRYARFYTVILLGVMVLNICKYRIPYIQYNLFGNYIAENLCVNRYDENNCCLGKCFLEKQINLVNETDENSSPGNKGMNPPLIQGTDDYVFNDNILIASTHFTKIQLSVLTDNRLRSINLDIPLPPPKQRFIFI